MSRLDELGAVAAAAAGCDCYEACMVAACPEHVRPFLAMANASTVLALLRVARAAKAFAELHGAHYLRGVLGCELLAALAVLDASETDQGEKR